VELAIAVKLVKLAAAVVMIKIHAPLDPTAHQALLAPMEKTEPMEEKAKLDLKVLAKDTNHHQDHRVANDAHLDPKETQDLLDPLEHLVEKVNLAREVVMVIQVAALPAQLVMLVPLEVMDNQAHEVTMVPMPKLEAKALLVAKDKTVDPVQPETTEIKALLVIPDPPAPLDHPDQLAELAKMEEKETLVLLVVQAPMARTPNIVLAHIVRRNTEFNDQHETRTPLLVYPDILICFAMLVLVQKPCDSIFG